MGKHVKLAIIGGYLVILAIFTLAFQHVLIGGWSGIIVGNLLANLYWAPIGVFHLDSLQRKHHAENMAAHRGTSKLWTNSLYGKSSNIRSNYPEMMWSFTNIETRQRTQTIDPIIAIQYFRDPDWVEGLV